MDELTYKIKVVGIGVSE